MLIGTFMREEQDTTRSLRIGLMASSILEALQQVHSAPTPDQVKSSLMRAIEFLSAAQAFCDHRFEVTPEGVTSNEAFSAIVAAGLSAPDLRSLGTKLGHLINHVQVLLDAGATDTTELEKLFNRIRIVALAERTKPSTGVEKWRL